VPIFIEETNPGITDNQNSFSGISFPGSNANYVGQTMGPGGMGMSAYMDRPETQPGWTGYDYSPSYNTNTYNLGQTDGPVGMGISAYMDRPGPMEMAAPPDNIGYDRMGPGPWNEFNIPNSIQKGKGLPPRVYTAGLFDDPTADGGWIDNLSRWWYGDDDPESDFDYEPLPEDFKGMAPPRDPFYDPDLPLLDANLESNDLYHLMRNGYTLEEAQEILNEQIGDGSFEVAELSDPQINFMNSPMGTPDFFSSYQDYKDMVDSYEEKGFWPFKSGQESATDPEVIEYIKERYGTLPWSTVI